MAFSNLLTVAYWGTNTVEVFELSSTLKSVAISPSLPAIVRSLVLYNFGTGESSKFPNHYPYLLAGLGDGSVATMSWKEIRKPVVDGGSGRDVNLSDLKVTSLGHAPVNLSSCEVDGRKSVLAAGNRATVFFMEKGRLVNSPIMLKARLLLSILPVIHQIRCIQEISASCSLNTAAFPASLVLAAPGGLFIGCVKDVNKMHIRTVSSYRWLSVACLDTFRVGAIRTRQSSSNCPPAIS